LREVFEWYQKYVKLFAHGKINFFLIVKIWIWSSCCQFHSNATLKLPCLSTNATRCFRS
jgi:hypothetical protein